MFQGADLRRRFVRSTCVAVAAVLAATTGAVFAAEKDPAKVGAPDCNFYTSSTGNPIYSYEDCTSKGYVPDVVNADAQSRDIALRLFINALTFCTKYPNHQALSAAGWKGEKGTENGSHWRNPNAQGDATIKTTEGVIKAAAYPDAAVVADPNGRIGQLMWEGKGIAKLGSIPLLHDHTHNQKHEMLHVQCAPTIEGMFGFERYDLIGDQPELQAALQAAQTGGLAAVSTQLKSAGGTAVVAPAAAPQMSQPAAGVQLPNQVRQPVGTVSPSTVVANPVVPTVRSQGIVTSQATGQRLTAPWAANKPATVQNQQPFATSPAATTNTFR